ncbi:alpha-galactosidase, partial [bacterium]|nr:alpha-galactosidase [bacterium]
DELQVKRIFRLYPNCPVIACDLYFRGKSDKVWLQPGSSLADMVNLEKVTPGNAGLTVPVIENLELPGKHWGLEAVEFFDITDRFNTLVNKVETLSYRPNFYRGNLLFGHDEISGSGVFLLKEAPTSNVQLAYPGSDFMTEFGALKVVGAGLNPADLDPLEWRRGYGFATGVYSGDVKSRYLALREYQKNLRLHQPGRDEMVLMNTWGDRGQDSRIRESFAMAELEAGAKLGISHFQLDDGWQSGRSSNSAQKGGSLENIWSNENYWKPDPDKFPNGLEPVVKKGKELGIDVCLWFNPSKDNSNADWEKDADVVIGLHQKYGITTFKIDGVNLPDKTAEVNFRKFLDKVDAETAHRVVFNLDVTAMRRGGYHYFNEYGNIFLENRYTDWQNYYPYTTLRNLWMLSKYIPAQNLQIEFLNKWRNAEKYAGDPFGPANHSFDYLFAITMAAQPLAWFEGTGLPAEAVSVAAPVIRKYREIQEDFHRGSMMPIGDEPSGKSWTGFQSVQPGRGYFLVFREANESPEKSMETWLPEGTKINCTLVMGQGANFSATAGKAGGVNFRLGAEKSYALYRYSIQ